MEKITKRAVDALKPSKVGIQRSDSFLWDKEIRGFGVRCKPSGLKTYFIQYRNAEGRTRKLTLGRHGILTPELARQMAREKLLLVAQGFDPSEERQLERDGMTVDEVCDWYLLEAEAGRLLGRRRNPIKKSTLKMDRSRIDCHIRPLVGRRRVSALKLADIEGMQADIVAGKTAKPRSGNRGGAIMGGPGTAASRTVSTLHSVFAHAERLGIIEVNPAKGVRKLASEPRERRLSTAEIGLLGKAMREAEVDGEHPVGLAVVRLWLLTGFRRMEAVGMHRAWVDARAGCVRLPDSKSGARVRAVGKAAATLIAVQPMRRGSPYVFPADCGDGFFAAAVSVLARVCAAARLEGVTPHTLRHTFASVAGDLGFSELTIRALLGHAARGVTQRYVHIDEAVRLAADRVSAEIAKLLDGGRQKGGLDAQALEQRARPSASR